MRCNLLRLGRYPEEEQQQLRQRGPDRRDRYQAGDIFLSRWYFLLLRTIHRKDTYTCILLSVFARGFLFYRLKNENRQPWARPTGWLIINFASCATQPSLVSCVPRERSLPVTPLDDARVNGAHAHKLTSSRDNMKTLYFVHFFLAFKRFRPTFLLLLFFFSASFFFWYLVSQFLLIRPY